jgi:GTPase Era involved in 16S rRNA processing
MSEDIKKIDTRFAPLTDIEAEEIQVREADLILALLTSQKELSGVYTELLLYRNVPDFYNKTILLLPKLSTKETKKLGFAANVFNDFNTKNVLPYTQDEFNKCETMREFCRKRVNAYRIKQLLEHPFP